jgi:hypothetical protein
LLFANELLELLDEIERLREFEPDPDAYGFEQEFSGDPRQIFGSKIDMEDFCDCFANLAMQEFHDDIDKAKVWFTDEFLPYWPDAIASAEVKARKRIEYFAPYLPKPRAVNET